MESVFFSFPEGPPFAQKKQQVSKIFFTDKNIQRGNDCSLVVSPILVVIHAVSLAEEFI